MVYDEYGDKRKPTILLLHGAGVLDTFAKQYDELSKQYHLLVPHLPGAGKAASFAYVPDATDHDLLELISSLPNKPIGVIGHSLGAQIAIRLVSKMPARFQFAIFLSAWVVPDPLMSKVYCSLAPFCAALLHFKWLVAMQGQYWNFSQKQIETMSQYSKQISASVYRSFFCAYFGSIASTRIPKCFDSYARDLRKPRNQSDEGIACFAFGKSAL